MSDTVLLERDGPIQIIRLNRPDKKNALTEAMYLRWVEGIVEAEKDPAIRVILVTGTGGNFTAGNDLGDFLQNPPVARNAPVARILDALAAAKKPMVAAVEGVAVGAGTTFLLHHDFVYAGRSAMFVAPFVNLGLVPEAASSLLLPLRAGQALASRVLMLGEPFDADTAMAAGLLTEVCEDGQAEAAALATAHKLAEKPAEALRRTKELLRTPLEPVLHRMVEEMTLFREMLQSPEAKEAFQAFKEKRKPDFSRFG